MGTEDITIRMIYQIGLVIISAILMALSIDIYLGYSSDVENYQYVIENWK